MDTTQTTVTLSPDDLEALIRRVVREELDRQLLVTLPDTVDDKPTELIEKNGLLVAHGEPLADLQEFVQNERQRRLRTLVTKIGL